jgi:hypothetical protein
LYNLKNINNFSWYLIWFKKKNQNVLKKNLITTIEIYRFFNHKWYFDFIYNYYIGYTILFHSYNTFYKLIDKGLIEIFGVQGFSSIIYKVSVFFSKKQLGYIYHLSFLLVLSLFFLFCLTLIF